MSELERELERIGWGRVACSPSFYLKSGVLNRVQSERLSIPELQRLCEMWTRIYVSHFGRRSIKN